MSRKFIAAVLAVSTTIAAFSAAPARAASDQDVARILGAAATIFIIGKAIEQSRGNNRDDKKDDRRRGADHYKSVPQVIQRDFRPRNTASALPAQCVRRIQNGKVNRVVMERCLERNYRSARALPNACKMTVGTQQGRRTAYALPCLRNRGYTLARN